MRNIIIMEIGSYKQNKPVLISCSFKKTLNMMFHQIARTVSKNDSFHFQLVIWLQFLWWLRVTIEKNVFFCSEWNFSKCWYNNYFVEDNCGILAFTSFTQKLNENFSLWSDINMLISNLNTAEYLSCCPKCPSQDLPPAAFWVNLSEAYKSMRLSGIFIVI